MFQLTKAEQDALRSQSVISNQRKGRGGRRFLPYAFTEQGVAMLSSVLQSERAIRVNVEITRTFVRLRRWLISHEDLARRLDQMEMKYDTRFKIVFTAIKKLMEPPKDTSKEKIGF